MISIALIAVILFNAVVPSINVSASSMNSQKEIVI